MGSEQKNGNERLRIDCRETFLTRRELAAWFRVSMRTIERWEKSSGLPVIRRDGKVLYNTKEVERWVLGREK